MPRRRGILIFRKGCSVRNALRGEGQTSLLPTGKELVKTIAQNFFPPIETVAPTSSQGWPDRERRILYEKNDPAELEILPEPGPRIGARVMDISRAGLRVWLRSRIEGNAEVKVQLRSDAVISGKVRYSRRRGAGFDAVIVVREVTCAPEPDKQMRHLHCAELALYLVNKRSTNREVLRVQGHLDSCKNCRALLARIFVAWFGPEAQQ